MNSFEIVSIISAVAYLLVTFLLSRGLQKNDSRKSETSEIIPKTDLTVTVIVAARNEEKNIIQLLDSLKSQTYPVEMFSVVVVNDRSTDSTKDIVDQYAQTMSNLECISIESVPSGIAPKKNAISHGILHSFGEIILVTDADCVVPSRWIEEIVDHFQNPQVGLVQGLTLYPKREGYFHRFQRLDFFSHSVVAAAGIGSNLPINSNANNFAYRRDLFQSLKGFEGCEHIVSGDDDLLLQKVWEQGKWGISYVFSLDAAVVTLPTESIADFIQQRKRWGSKTVFYKAPQLVTLLIIFSFYCIIAINSFLACTPWGSLLFVLLLYFLKLLGELLFLIPGMRVFHTSEMGKDISWCSPIQLWVVLYSVFSGVFTGFTWKGTAFKKTVKRN